LKIAIIGFGSAGYAALMAIKKKNPGAEITVIDPKKHDLLHTCGLPYSLEGIVKEEDLEQDINLKRMGVSRIEALAESIDAARKKISIQQDDRFIEISYDAAIIATGNKPVIPQIKGIEKALNNGLYTLTDINDLSMIKDRLKASRIGIVIGAGAIGLETAIALKNYIERVIVVEMTDQVLPGILDRDISKTVEKHLAEAGIKLYLNSRVDEVKTEGHFSGVIISDDLIEGDIAILATGFKANTEMAIHASIECGNNGIVVDEHLRTSLEGVYAAGDCISSRSIIDGEGIGAKLATMAYKQGTIAGINAAGGSEEYQGSAGTFVSKIGDLEIAGTGYTAETARQRGHEPIIGKITTYLLPEYFPGGDDITVKVIADKRGKILGAQAIGKNGAAGRINLISMAIECNIPVKDLMSVELAYCPPVSEINDPIMRALDFLIRRIR
jgi:NADH oxidase (H2O2-forming)